MSESLKGIVIKQPWTDLILDGSKTWEIRSRRARPQRVVALIRSGSGRIVGLARLARCVGALSAEQLAQLIAKHRVPPERMHEVPYREFFAWELTDVRRLAPAGGLSPSAGSRDLGAAERPNRWRRSGQPASEGNK